MNKKQILIQFVLTYNNGYVKTCNLIINTELFKNDLHKFILLCGLDGLDNILSGYGDVIDRWSDLLMTYGSLFNLEELDCDLNTSYGLITQKDVDKVLSNIESDFEIEFDLHLNWDTGSVDEPCNILDDDHLKLINYEIEHFGDLDELSDEISIEMVNEIERIKNI